jgi:hypothetical protein
MSISTVIFTSAGSFSGMVIGSSLESVYDIIYDNLDKTHYRTNKDALAFAAICTSLAGAAAGGIIGYMLSWTIDDILCNESNLNLGHLGVCDPMFF